jgi:hypothetical protein
MDVLVPEELNYEDYRSWLKYLENEASYAKKEASKETKKRKKEESSSEEEEIEEKARKEGETKKAANE